MANGYPALCACHDDTPGGRALHHMDNLGHVPCHTRSRTMATRPRPSLDVKTFIDVASHWAHEDDWGVTTIYIGTLEDIAVALAAGDEPGALARHAKHTKRDCDRFACASRIPHTFTKEA